MGVYHFIVLFFGAIYIPLGIYLMRKIKFNLIGLLLVFFSFVNYLILGAAFMMGAGTYVDSGLYEDGYSSTLFCIGLPKLALLSYPYIFLILAVVLGKKGEEHNKSM